MLPGDSNSLVEYLAPDGTPISWDEWARLWESRREDAPESWWRKESMIGDVRVSTVWLGLNHAWPLGSAPLYWETMLFGGEHDERQWRYSSREAALDDHERILRELRAGQEPD